MPSTQGNNKLAARKKADTFTKVVEEFNATDRPYPNLTVSEIFDQVAEEFPDKTAIEFGAQAVDYFANPFASSGQKTYKELAEESNQICRFLQDKGVQKEDRVALLLDDNIDTIVILLGILKAGAAYVSISPDFPFDRKKVIIEDVSCKILIVSKDYIKSANRLQWECAHLETILCIDSDMVLQETEEENELMKKDLWDYVGEDAQDDIQGGGWKNSYTGEDLSRQVMDEYGDNILHKLKPLLNSETRVLEIGCSSGISLFRLAPLVKSYYGVDLSSEILEKTEVERKKRGLENVTLQCLPAHKVDTLEEKDFDVIIINSVIQCFNGHNYLRDVIAKAMNLLGEKGLLFFGDIMDQDTKGELINSLLEFKRSNEGKGYTTKIDWSNELFISRKFFDDLAYDYPFVIDVTHSEKIFTVESELTNYRFDTIVSVDKNVSNDVITNQGNRYKKLFDKTTLLQYSIDPVEVVAKPSNMAYITYTSGTTGKPKGSIIEHKSIVRLVKNTNFIEITPTDNVAKTAPVSFDASTFEVWGALLNGATLHIIDKETLLDPKELDARLKGNKISIAWFTSFLFNKIVEFSPEIFSGLNTLLVGGDVLSPFHINQVRETCPNLTIINGYGPSENTTFSACFTIDKAYEKSIPIGKPIGNSQCYILNKKMEPQAVGVTGELYVSGDGLSRGYLNNPELTQEKFLDHPFKKGKKIYRTGDKAKWLADGTIRFIGRIDEQIKIRGYRVELDEIAVKIREVSGVEQVLVTIKEAEDGGKELYAYLETENKLNTKQLKKDLALFIPEYMVPNHVFTLEQFPLTSNGKVDRRLLPDSEASMEVSGYITPRNETEKKLLEIWKAILGLQRIGVNENFFDCGGHSLKATQLISQVQKEMDTDISIREVFSYPTIMQLAQIIDERENGAFQQIDPIEVQELYLASHGQKRLWILDQLEEKSLAYHTGVAFKLTGNLNVTTLEKALNALIDRHEILRTTFSMHDGVLKQKVHEPHSFNFRLKYKSLIDKGSEAADLARTEINQEASIPFDLTNGPLFRVCLVQVEENNYSIIFSMHHIISDGWSLKVMVGDLTKLYEAHENEGHNAMQPLRIQYKDYAAWQAKQLSGNQLKEHQEYWWSQFDDEIPVLDLPVKAVRPLTKGYKAGSLHFVIDRKIKVALSNFGAQTGATLFMLLAASIKNLFYRYTGQEDIILGFPIAGREHQDLKDQIGLYLNTLPLRTKFSGEENFVQLLNRVRENTLSAYEYQIYPFDNLVDDLDLERDMSRHPLFDVMIVLQNIDLNIDKDLPDMGGVKIENYAPDTTSNKFDLVFNFSEQNNQFTVNIDYDTDLFTQTTVERLFKHYLALLNAALEEPTLPLYQLDYLDSQEQKDLVQLSYGERDTTLLGNSVLSQYSNQVVANPSATAIICDERTVSYADFDKNVNRLANYLEREFDVKPGDRIGVLSNRTELSIVACFAILKLRTIYMPLDTKGAIVQLGEILDETNPKAVLTTTQYLSQLKDNGIQAVALDDLNIDEQAVERVHPEYNSNDVAYTIFTSGSTGHRKGVDIKQQSLTNLCNWYQGSFEITEDANVLLMVPLSFDASVKNIIVPLMVGGRLTLMSNENNDPEEIVRIIETDQVTHINCVPSAFQALLEVAKLQNYKALSSLKYLALGGELVETAFLQEWLSTAHCQATIVNLYGPTEATDTNTCFFLRPGATISRSVLPIGKPVPNGNVYVLDEQLQLVPEGVRGELCIAGQGVAKGYINREQLNKEKFVDDPFSGQKDSKMYRTGDIGRWLPDGNLEFIGRKDSQVKVRGYRIELGEIENTLNSYQAIEKAKVVVQKDNNGLKNLVAYFIGEPSLKLEDIRQHLKQHVANYMIPAYFVRLEQFPQTSSGKTNTKKLPSPFHASSQEIQVLGAASRYIGPRNKKEKDLLVIWQNLLGREKIGIHDNFFAIGGDSIKALQIVARAFEQGYKMEMKQIYSHPTIAELTPYLREAVHQGEQGIVTGELPLTPIQMGFVEEVINDPFHFNQAVMLRLDERLEPDTVSAIFTKIQEQHDALRISLKRSGADSILQNNDLSHLCSVQEFDLTTVEDEHRDQVLTEKATSIQSSIDLENGPLMKIGLFHLKESDRLLIVIHHLVVDGISWRVLFEDLEKLYQQHKEGQPFNLSFKTTSFKEWSHKLSDYANSKQALREVDYWTKLTNETYDTIPRDFPDGSCHNSELVNFDFRLSEENTKILLTQVNQAFNTEINDILLTALGLAFKKTFGLSRIMVELEGHGRESIIEHIDISRTVGWFTSFYPVLLDVGSSEDTATQIKTIKEHLHRIPNKGIGYGIGKYLTDAKYKKGFDYAIQPQIIFNYLGQFDTDVENLSFKVAKEGVGPIQSPLHQRKHDLDISGMVAEQQLNIVISFSEKQYKNESIDQLRRHYKSSLEELISYCSGQQSTIPTPSDFIYKDLSFEALDTLTSTYAVEDIYPLSSLQEGLLFHSLYDTNSQAYFEQISYCVEADLDPSLVEKATIELSRRHDILRTSFVHEGVIIPLQVVSQDRTIAYDYNDLSQMASAEDRAQKLEEHRKTRLGSKMDLATDILMRLSLVKLRDGQYEFIWNYHHILMDGWCLGILIQEFYTLYSSYVTNEPHGLVPAVPYKNYIRWLIDQDQEKASAYWKEYLHQYEEVAVIPQKNAVAYNEQYDDGSVSFQINEKLTGQLNTLSTHYNVTLNTILQAAWGIVLSRYTQRRDVVFGAVVSGRPAEIAGIERMVGLLINTLPVRIKYSQEDTIETLISRTQQSAIASEAYQHCNLADIQTSSAQKEPLFDHILVYENYPLNAQVKEGMASSSDPAVAMEISDVSVFEQTNYNLSIIINPGEAIQFTLAYNKNVYDTAFIESIAGHVQQAVQQIVSHPEGLVDQINIVSDHEREMIFAEFNDTNAVFDQERNIHQIFEEKAGQAPDAVAVVHQDKALTYRQLNEKANQVAHHLRSAVGKKPNDIVAVVMQPSEMMISVLLGIIKAGAAYLPIATDYPKERISFMLRDAEAKALVTADQKYISGLDLDGIEVLDLEEGANELDQLPVQNPENRTKPDHLAYILYTSGSTGRPKGCMLTHGNVIRLLQNDQHPFEFTSGDVFALSHAYIFDVSVWEMYGALLHGAKLVVPTREEVKDATKFAQIIKEQKVTVLNQTPLVFEYLSEELRNIGGLDQHLRYIIFAGERLEMSKLRDWAEAYPPEKIALVNMYGITETTVVSTYHSITSEEIQWPHKTKGSLIGLPMPENKFYVLDNERRLLPPGVVGEFYMGGTGISKGYLNNDELTNQRFINAPFDPGQRLYKTGDAGRWLHDGRLEFFGRIDHQVKIRGYRIELGEIEQQLLAIEGVRHAIVRVVKEKERNDGLVAYVVAEKELDQNMLRSHLSQKLPHYMVPAFFARIDEVPLNISGKVDYTKLPQISEESTARTNDYVAPRNEVEERLVEIWKELLKVEKIGVSDNFFDLGGHSLKAIRVLSRIQETFGVKIVLESVYEHPTIERIGEIISTMDLVEDERQSGSESDETLYEEITI